MKNVINYFCWMAVFSSILFLTCNNAMTNKDRDKVKEVLGVELPEYVTNVHFKSESFMSLMAYLRCDVPLENLSDFLNSNAVFPKEISEKNVAPVDFSVYNESSAWWTPLEHLTSPSYGEHYGTRDKWTTFSYIAVQKNEKAAQIYFMYFEEP